MKKLIALFTAAVLTAALLTGCGGKEDANSTPNDSQPGNNAVSTPADNGGNDETPDQARLDAIVASIEAVNEIPNPRAYTDLEFDIGMDLGVTTGNVVAFKGDVTNNGDDCALVLALQVKPGTVDSVKAELEKKREEMSSSLYAEYAEKVAKAQDARIYSDGNIVLFVISGINGPEYSAIDAAITSALAQ